MLHKKIIILKDSQTLKPAGSAVCYLCNGIFRVEIKTTLKCTNPHLLIEGRDMDLLAVTQGDTVTADFSADQFLQGFTAVLVCVKPSGFLHMAHGSVGAEHISPQSIVQRAKRRFVGGVFAKEGLLLSNQQDREYKSAAHTDKKTEDIPPKPILENAENSKNLSQTESDTAKTQASSQHILHDDKPQETDLIQPHTAPKELESILPYAKDTLQKEHAPCKEDYEQCAKELSCDPFMCEDTTLCDLDLIAEENYFEVSTFAQDSSIEDITAQYFDVSQETEHTQQESIQQEGIPHGGILPQSELAVSQTDKLSHFATKSAEDLDSAKASQWGEVKTVPGSAKSAEQDFAYRPRRSFGDGADPVMYINKGGRTMSYFDSVKDKLLPLLSANQKEKMLEEMIPSSDFVKVDCGQDKYYAVGLIYSDGTPEYICYGVPAIYSPQPPVQFEGMARWMPLSHAQPEGQGYFMLFQSAADGSLISAE